MCRAVLKQLMRLEQYYETDEVVLSLGGEAASEFVSLPKDDMINQLLKYEILLKVNVGLSATDPMNRVKNLMFGIQALGGFPGIAERINMPEVAKEIFGQLGYKDGSRFISFEDDPRIEELQGQLQELQMLLKSEQLKLENRLKVEQMKQAGNKEVASIKAGSEVSKTQIKAQLDYIDLQLKQEDVETRRAELMLQREALINQIAEQELERQAEMVEGGEVGVMARDDYNQIPYAVG